MIRLSDTLDWIKVDFEDGLLTPEEAIERAFDAGFSEGQEVRDTELDYAYDEGYAEGRRDTQHEYEED